jgi:hypothetical protein
MSAKPNFFIVGAPKCGTTSLSDSLRGHPDVFFSRVKEPDHFNAEQMAGHDEYLRRHFSGVCGQKAIGEGSTHYLSSEVAIARILEFNPASKFIVMLRDPVEMAVSLYYEEKSQLVEDAPSFADAWELQPERTDSPALQYGRICRTGRQLARLFEIVPDRTNVLVIDFARFARAQAAVYAEVIGFLGLEHDGRRDFPRSNPRRAARFASVEKALRAVNESGWRMHSARIRAALGIGHWPLLGPLLDNLRRANLTSAAPEPVPPALLLVLEDYFRHDVALVRSLTGINLYGQ